VKRTGASSSGGRPVRRIRCGARSVNVDLDKAAERGADPFKPVETGIQDFACGRLARRDRVHGVGE
jgi:hypothetical protein